MKNSISLAFVALVAILLLGCSSKDEPKSIEATNTELEQINNQAPAAAAGDKTYPGEDGP